MVAKDLLTKSQFVLLKDLSPSISGHQLIADHPVLIKRSRV